MFGYKKKLRDNTLRKTIRERGYTLSDAAGALGVNSATLNGFLRAYDKEENLTARILALPDLSPVNSTTTNKEN